MALRSHLMLTSEGLNTLIAISKPKQATKYGSLLASRTLYSKKNIYQCKNISEEASEKSIFLGFTSKILWFRRSQRGPGMPQVVSCRWSVDHTFRKMEAQGWELPMSFYTREYRISSHCILLTCFHSISEELYNN